MAADDRKPEPLTPEERRRKIAKRAAIVGAVLALICHALPHDYKAACVAATKVFAATCG